MEPGDDHLGEVPDGAALFPEIPAELEIDPFWLAVLHGIVFLSGSTEQIVNPDAAEEALQGMVGYLQRLQPGQRIRLREDMACLVAFARQQRWPKGHIQTLKSFLSDLGLEPEDQEEAE
ncbi:MAG: hypothetical protein U0840_04315 [Gemmataceae bacterium]